MEYELGPEIVRIVSRAVKAAGLKPTSRMSDPERLVLSIASACHVEGERESLYEQLVAGGDPLGGGYASAKLREARRRSGTFYTPRELVEPMVSWVLARKPVRIVDAGCGSGRFALSAALKNPGTRVVAVDTDPVATILCRANAKILRLRNVEVRNADFTTFELSRVRGRTAYVGNPPYVRHHELGPDQKSWVSEMGRRLGYRASRLSGLHAYFFFATALRAVPGDIGCFVTSAEWLDNNYGAGIRELLLDGLGIESLHLIATEALPFRDAMSTAVITCFDVGASHPLTRYQVVPSADEIKSLDAGSRVSRANLARATKWGRGLREGFRGRDEGLTRLGEIASVHRGAVTGANNFFVMSKTRAAELGLTRFVKPVIVAAQEILAAGGVLRAADLQRVVLDLPRDIDLTDRSSEGLRHYLKTGEKDGVHKGYICSRRTPWWSIGFRDSPPIVATYMARQAPAFALNPDGARVLNIAHGIYPHERLSQSDLGRFVEHLTAERQSFSRQGRVYQGGLQKFEPGEMEELLLRPW